MVRTPQLLQHALNAFVKATLHENLHVLQLPGFIMAVFAQQLGSSTEVLLSQFHGTTSVFESIQVTLRVE